MFSSTEMVIRSGAQPIGEWVEEKINVYEDFKKIHEHEPMQEAWGISLLGGPGSGNRFWCPCEVHKE